MSLEYVDEKLRQGILSCDHKWGECECQEKTIRKAILSIKDQDLEDLKDVPPFPCVNA